MRILPCLFVMFLLIFPALAGEKTARSCTLKNKELCGRWVQFTLYGDSIRWDRWSEWDKQYGDIAHCTVLDERRQPGRIFSIIRCIEQHHTDALNCKEELASRPDDKKPQRCIDPVNGKGQSYTIEQPTFWLFMVYKVRKQEPYGHGIAYTYITDNHINCLFPPMGDENGNENANQLIKFQEENSCFSYRHYSSEVKRAFLPDFAE
ncbi:MAG TPA: hypothetical protein VGF14_03760 [Alphaproteobacteria bacterium]